MLGDIEILSEGTFGYDGDEVYQVVAGTPTAILAGEPVAKDLGQQYVTALATNKPVVGTDYMAGVAGTSSTETASLDGTVRVLKMNEETTYLIDPKNPLLWDTQAEYDALVGARVLLDLTSGKYTILAADGATNGCVVKDLDIKKHPGKVAFSFRAGCNFLA